MVDSAYIFVYIQTYMVYIIYVCSLIICTWASIKITPIHKRFLIFYSKIRSLQLATQLPKLHNYPTSLIPTPLQNYVKATLHSQTGRSKPELGRKKKEEQVEQ